MEIRAESMCLVQILMPATAQSNATNNSALPANIGQAINQTFGNYTVFKKNFTEAALSVFGSGLSLHAQLSICLYCCKMYGI